MDWKIFDFLEGISNSAYLVGGTVRDILNGVEPYDEDYYIVVDSVGDAVVEITENFGDPLFTLDVAGDTVLVYPGWDVRIAKDWKNAKKNEEWFSRTADFTVNSMLMRRDGKVIDPLHVGTKHLKKRVIVPVRDDIFSKEPRTIVRAYRLKARGYKLVQRTAGLIYSTPSEAVSKIPPGYIYTLFERTFDESPEAGLRFFKYLVEDGILDKHECFRKCHLLRRNFRGYKHEFRWRLLSELKPELVYATFFIPENKLNYAVTPECGRLLPPLTEDVLRLYFSVLRFGRRTTNAVKVLLDNYYLARDWDVRAFLDAVIPMRVKGNLEEFYASMNIIDECIKELFPGERVGDILPSRKKRSELRKCFLSKFRGLAT